MTVSQYREQRAPIKKNIIEREYINTNFDLHSKKTMGSRRIKKPLSMNTLVSENVNKYKTRLGGLTNVKTTRTQANVSTEVFFTGQNLNDKQGYCAWHQLHYG